MNDSTSIVSGSSAERVSAARPKRKYEAPELTAFGSVEDFTRSGGSKSFDKGRGQKQAR